MAKDNFLDTNIIINYSNYNDEGSKDIVKKCYSFVKNKNGHFIVCGAVIEKLSNHMIKRANIHKAVIKKIEDENFSFDSMIPLKDVPFAIKLYGSLKDKGSKKASIELSKERDISDIMIQRFLKILVDEKVIPVGSIDNSLVNKIHDIIQNHADCKILASAIQLQKDREIFFFVTADAKDLDPNGYHYLKEHFEINYPKEKYKFPELRNLLFE